MVQTGGRLVHLCVYIVRVSSAPVCASSGCLVHLRVHRQWYVIAVPSEFDHHFGSLRLILLNFFALVSSEQC